MNRAAVLKRKRMWGLIIAVKIVLIAACTIFVLDYLTEKNGVWEPDYQPMDLTQIALKETLSQEDYHTLFFQTGLGKDAVDELIKNNPPETIGSIFGEYQEDFFSSGIYECRRIGIITYEEKTRDENGMLKKNFQIPSLKNGDILITKSTHSIGWRHGHTAIVTNASRGETLEAILLGNPSSIQNITKWQSYSSFIQLRLRNDAGDIADDIAEFAFENLNELPYGLLSGFPEKAPGDIGKTQCSHLVWYPYYEFGYDIDSDGSWLVTPKDIANSDLFEVVQVYGVNPEEIWP